MNPQLKLRHTYDWYDQGKENEKKKFKYKKSKKYKYEKIGSFLHMLIMQ